MKSYLSAKTLINFSPAKFERKTYQLMHKVDAAWKSGGPSDKLIHRLPANNSLEETNRARFLIASFRWQMLWLELEIQACKPK